MTTPAKLTRPTRNLWEAIRQLVASTNTDCPESAEWDVTVDGISLQQRVVLLLQQASMEELLAVRRRLDASALPAAGKAVKAGGEL